MANDYLTSVQKQFAYYKMLGEKAMAQIRDDKIFFQYNDDSNSIAAIIHHLSGNMLSRWTDFLTSDGEKEWRDRDAEFDNTIQSRQQLMERWDKGWKCLFDAIETLTVADLAKEIFIRNEAHTVTEAINRQLAHYPYHIGQVVYIAKMFCNNDWKTLSIAKGASKDYNTAVFATPSSTARLPANGPDLH